MNKLKKLIALTTMMALFGSQVQAQGQEVDGGAVDDSAAYYDSGRASYLSAALPIGAIAVAAVIIATTGNRHHHSSSSSSSSSSNNSHRRHTTHTSHQ
jgi:hypothetical protein